MRNREMRNRDRFLTTSDRLSGDEPLSLFSGLSINFAALSHIEKVVCCLIAMIPVWWLWGWSYLHLLLFLAVFAYEIKKERGLSLNNPSWVVGWALVFGFYTVIVGYFYLTSNNIPFSPRQLLGAVESWIAPGFLLWYIQSKKLKVRLQVVAWAFSVIIALMLVVFLVSVLVFQQADYVPLRSIFGFLTGKSTEFEHGLGNSNYLIPYFAKDESFIPGLVRYVFFFHGPESLALTSGFVVLLALDLKNRTWSLSLFAGAYFISLLSGTRSVFVTLIMVVILRYVITAGKTFGVALIMALLASISFATFTLPTTSNMVFDTVDHAVQGVNEARADSSQGRGEIYVETWQRVVNAPDVELMFGHVIPGETVTPTYEPAKIGTHSFYLSTLLYRGGVFGTLIFIGFWGTLCWRFYQNQDSQPLCCLLILVLFSLTFCVMELERPVMPLILVCSMLDNSLTRRDSSTDRLSPTNYDLESPLRLRKHQRNYE